LPTNVDMKLYYSPSACSLSPHIALCEAGMPFDLVLVNTRTHKLADGTDYYSINPKGYVPLLELDSGERLTEGPAIVQWIADQVPDKKLAPPLGTMSRYRLMEWLNFIGTEMHKQFSPLFNPALPEDAKPLFREKLLARFRYADTELAEKLYLMGSDFTVADGYLFVVARWASAAGLDLSGLGNLARFVERMTGRPAVQQALEAEARRA
jgi:glutathione S-transferase